MGSALTIAFPTPLAAGATASVEVSYKTSPSSSAVQWLRPEQTAGGSHPYLFTQCQAIHARSLYPCQDSPAAKMTYEAKVSAPSALTALMSAIPTGSTPAPGGAKTTYAFEQKVPIPPYLLALAVGDLESRGIDWRALPAEIVDWDSFQDSLRMQRRAHALRARENLESGTPESLYWDERYGWK